MPSRELEDCLVGNGNLKILYFYGSTELTAAPRLFAIEGAITVALSVLVFFTLPDCGLNIS